MLLSGISLTLYQWHTYFEPSECVCMPARFTIKKLFLRSYSRVSSVHAEVGYHTNSDVFNKIVLDPLVNAGGCHLRLGMLVYVRTLFWRRNVIRHRPLDGGLPGFRALKGAEHNEYGTPFLNRSHSACHIRPSFTYAIYMVQDGYSWRCT